MADEVIDELEEEEEEEKEYEEEEVEAGDDEEDEERETLVIRYDEDAEEDVTLEEEPEEEVLTLEQAQSSLSLLGRTASGLQHAYLMANLSDLHLTDISILPTFRYLLFVNVSGNLLSDDHIQVLSKMAQLLSIQADRNRLTKPYFPPMNYLQVLTLNSNKISATTGIAHPILECLELNHNQIQEVHDLYPEDLPCLRVLELRGNSLSTTSGIRLESLEILYLSSNSLERLEGLEKLVNLRILHLRDNPLTTLDGFSHTMTALRYLNMRSCQLESAEETRKLAVLPALEVLVVLGNPFAQQEDEEEEERYRLEVLAFLPRLKRLDKTAVSEEDLEQARELRAEMEQPELQEAEDTP